MSNTDLKRYSFLRKFKASLLQNPSSKTFCTEGVSSVSPQSRFAPSELKRFLTMFPQLNSFGPILFWNLGSWTRETNQILNRLPCHLWLPHSLAKENLRKGSREVPSVYSPPCTFFLSLPRLYPGPKFPLAGTQLSLAGDHTLPIPCRHTGADTAPFFIFVFAHA